MILNHNTVHLTESQKHLGIVLDSRLDFNKHLENILALESIGYKTINNSM